MQNKIFNIKLNVLTPIHIGDGTSYDPTDYKIEGNELHIIDKDKFIQKINSNKALYDDFLSKIQDFTIQNTDLIDFIREHSQGLYQYALKLDDKAAEYVKKYPKQIGRAPIEKFIRNSYDDTIYIPGSSVKGALRSAIIEVIFRRLIPKEPDICADSKIREELLKTLVSNNSAESDQKNANKKQKLSPEVLLNRSFKPTDAQNDLLKYVSVSDFVPNKAILQVCEPANKSALQENNIPVLLECAMPGSVFEGTIVFKEKFFIEFDKILSKIAQYKKELSMEHKKTLFVDFDSKLLAEWIRANYNDRVLQCEKNFSIHLEDRENNFIMKIGKHAGALSKSIAGLRKINVNAFNPESSRKETSVLSSQTTFWYIDNKPMGWVVGEVS